MAVIQKIQRQTGCLLILVGGAMIAFVLTDLLNSGGAIFGGRNDNNVGVVAGEAVSYAEFNERFETMVANLQAANPELEINEGIRDAYREQAWNQMISEKIIGSQYDQLGIMVTPDEMEDNTFGNNPHPQVISAFTDPQSGEFNKARLIQFLQQDIENNENAKNQWLAFEKGLKEQLLNEKYATLIRSSFYTPTAFVKQRVKDQDETVSAEIVGIDYTVIADTAVSFTDKDLQKYINEHKEDYKQENARDIEYISYNVLPTRDDTMSVFNWAADQKEKFSKAENDSVFVELMNSETPLFDMYQPLGAFPQEIERDLFTGDSADVFGPVFSQGSFGLYKISGIGTDSLYSFRMSHILIPVEGPTIEDTLAARRKASETMAAIRSGEKSFDEEAVKNYDGSGARKGDLGYIREDSRAQPKKLIDAGLSNAEGNLFVVTTDRGVHIGKVTFAKTKRTLKVAVLNQTVSPSNETYKEVYRQAGTFIGLANKEGFDAAVDQQKLSKRIAENIKESDRAISGLKDPKPLIRWAFDAETQEGSLSDILEMEDRFIVAHCKAVKEEGVAGIEDVRTDVESKVRELKKADLIEKQLQDAMQSATDFAEIAKKLNTSVRSIPSQSFDNDNVSYIGVDFEVLGTLFGLEDGNTSGIVKADRGVYLIKRTGTNAMPDIQEIEPMRDAFTSELKDRSEAEVQQALRKKAEIKDLRYKFY
jgi:peptidyl-prolyl cis-trans isomerase D